LEAPFGSGRPSSPPKKEIKSNSARYSQPQDLAMAAFHRSDRTERARNGACVDEDGALKKNGRGKNEESSRAKGSKHLFRN
jgi:hypothetical protein